MPMGFPPGYYDDIVPKFLFNLAFVLACIKHGLCCLLSWFGLAESPTWQDFSEVACDISSVPARSIRQMLPVIGFGEFVERIRETEEDLMCSVCLNYFQEDDEIRELCNCSHVFHRKCLDRWIDQLQNTCPLCRCSLLAAEEGVRDAEERDDHGWFVDRISYLLGQDLVG